MSKYKIEVEIDVDFDKFFDNIPEGLYEDKEGCDEHYELESIHRVLHNIHLNALSNTIEWMTKKDYKCAEHHLLIEQEISKQITENSKVQKIV